MDFAIPADLQAYLAELDAFIAAEIKPLEQQDDNIRFFDHRREYARTDFEAGGLPRHEHYLALVIYDAASNLMTVISYLYLEGPKILRRHSNI